MMLLATGNALLLGAGCGGKASDTPDHGAADRPSLTGKPPLITWNMTDKVTKTDEEWRRTLTPEQYRILRRKGTERAFTGAYWDNHEPGVYACAGCGLALFSSEHKFDSGTGWPSYWQPLRPEQVTTAPDNTLFMRRTEILCARCNSHLGHVFDDGPRPTGLRYCINSAALNFAPGPARAPGITTEAGHAEKPAPAP